MDKLEEVFDNFVESVGKQFNLPKEAVTLIQGGFAKYTAMCESANPFSRGNQIQNMQAKFTSRIVDALQAHIKPGSTSGSFKSRENGIPCKYEYSPDSFVITNENNGSVIYSGGGAGWLNDAGSVQKELKKAAHALLWGDCLVLSPEVILIRSIARTAGNTPADTYFCFFRFIGLPKCDRTSW